MLRVTRSSLPLLLIGGLLTTATERPAYAQVSAGSIGSRSGGLEPGGFGSGLDGTSTALIVGLGAAAYVSRAVGGFDGIVSAVDGTPLDGVVDAADLYGEGYSLGAAAMGLLALGEMSANARLTRAGKDLSSSLLAAWAVTWTLKLSINARRPNGGRYSFPSGHAATAFAAAPVVYRHFGRAAGTLAYGLAAFTGMARVEERKHFVHDVLVGAAIGIVAGRTFTGDGRLRLARPREAQGLGLSLTF